MDPATMMMLGNLAGGLSGGGGGGGMGAGAPPGAGKPDTNSSAAQSTIRGPVNVSIDSGGVNLGEIVKLMEGAGPPENGGWGVVAPSPYFGSARSTAFDSETLEAGVFGASGFNLGGVLIAAAIGLGVTLIARRFA